MSPTGKKQPVILHPSQGLSVGTLAGFTGMVLLQGGGCLPGAIPDDTATAPVVAALLADVGPSVVVPGLQVFVGALVELDVAVTDWQLALDAEADVSESLLTVQSSWLDAMSAWQRLEVIQIGPAASSLKDLGGQDFRDEIYSWPTINPCRVDQKTAEGAWGDASFFSDNLVNAYGLDALEHLLFSGLDTVCPSQVPPVSDGSWSALGEAGVTANRAAYAKALIAEASRQADALLEAWTAVDDGFSGSLSGEVASGPYENEQVALTAVFHAMFYLEKTTKDLKLGQPIGLGACEESTCPDDLEGIVSQRSLDSIVDNVLGFQEAFTGGEGFGFDDFLVDVGHGDLSESILEDVEAFLSVAESFDGTLYDAISMGSDQLDPLYAALSSVTRALKVDMVTVLSLTVPAEASGDND